MKHKSADVGISERIAHAIEGLRECEGSKMSLRFIAAMIGIPYRSLQDYINGVRLPGAEALQKLGKYGVNINWILLGDDEINFESEDGSAPQIEGGLLDRENKDTVESFGNIIPWINDHRERFVNDINQEFINKHGKSLPFRILLEINDHYVSVISGAYLKASDLISTLTNSGTQINDVLNVIEAALRDTLLSEAGDIISNGEALDCVPSAEAGRDLEPGK